MAAEHYGLAILASNIEDEPNNTTRFLVLGDYEPKPIGRDKTSLVLSAQQPRRRRLRDAHAVRARAACR